ncbi:MAG: hydroxypyruvate isomerase [Rhodocyclaceae bacterium]|nr:hydroxypyruvate isomerase [Rhodocyclaceae bacterium]
MPQFAANLTMLFNEVPFLDRFEAAARAGFTGVEYLFPYAWEADELAARLRDNGLVQVLHNLPPGNWDAGERGIACHPDRRDEFRDGVARGITYATRLGCPRLNCLAGIVPKGLGRDDAEAVFSENLAYAAGELARAGLKLLIEPINHFDIPGFLLTRSDQAMRLIEAVGAPNLYLQYDIYHAQRMEGELAATIARLLPRIDHMQLADNPGRHEPGSGEIHFPFLFGEIDRLGYDGWIGCEYRPAGDTAAGLGWLPGR